MPDDNAKVSIQLQLEVKELKKEIGQVEGQFKDFKKSIESMSSVFKKAGKEQTDVLKDIAKEMRNVSKAFASSEEKKKRAVNDTTRALKDQAKQIKATQAASSDRRFFGIKAVGTGGGFLGGLAGGLGVGALGGAITRQGMGAGIGRMLTGAVGAVGNFFLQGISNAYQTYMQYGQAQAGLAGLGTPGQLRGGLRAAGGVGGARLGYGGIETMGQARGIGRMAGNIGAVYRAQQFARYTGMDVGEIGGYMGMIRQAGFGFGGRFQGPGGQTRQADRSGTREFAKIIEGGILAGLEKGRLPEFVRGVTSVAQAVGAQVTGNVNVAGIAAFQTALNRSERAGLQGARGAQVMARLGQAIVRPGGGEAGQMMMMQALGWGKPGGTRGYYEALKMQQGGMQQPEIVADLFQEVYRQLGDVTKGGSARVNQEANIALTKILPISLQQAEDVGDLVSQGKLDGKGLAAIEEELKKARDPQVKALKATESGFLKVAQHLASVENTQIGIGATVGSYMMTIQKYQLRALKVMVDYIPEIAKFSKELFGTMYQYSKEAYNYWFVKNNPGVTYEEAARKSNIELFNLDYKTTGKTVAERLAQKEKQIEIYRQRVANFKTLAQETGPVGALWNKNILARAAYRSKLAVQEIARLKKEMTSMKKAAKTLGIDITKPVTAEQAPAFHGLVEDKPMEEKVFSEALGAQGKQPKSVVTPTSKTGTGNQELKVLEDINRNIKSLKPKTVQVGKGDVRNKKNKGETTAGATVQ